MKGEKKFQKWFRSSIAFIIVAILVVFANSVLAQEGTFRAKNGLYVGIGGANNTLEGDFDGTTALLLEGDLILVPEVDSGTGLKILIGSRSSKGAFELSYVQSDHDITFDFFSTTGVPLIIESEAELKLLNFDWKSFFISDQRIQPFILFGLNFSQLTAENFSFDGVIFDDAEFTGVGANLGGGVAYYFTPKRSRLILA